MEQGPNLWELRELFKPSAGNAKKTKSGKWVPARPLGLDTLKNRICCAWLVFTGQADAVIWP